MAGAGVAMLGCSTGVLHNLTPVAATRMSSGEPSTSSTPRLHLQGGRRSVKNASINLFVGRMERSRGRVAPPLVRASVKGEGERVREFASEKAVEGGAQLAADAKKLANGQSPGAFDAKADDAADAASYDSDFREKVVDVASDTAVDAWPEVDALAKQDAVGIAQQTGRSIDDAAQGLEVKAKEVTDREARKEADVGASSTTNSSLNDQVIKDKVIDVASDTAVDEQPEVKARAQAGADDMTSQVGGDARRNMATIEELAATAARLEAERSGSDVQTGATKKTDGEGKPPALEDLTKTVSKNLKEGIDAKRPGIEEISRNVAAGVRVGKENLEYGAEGAVQTGANAREGLEAAKEVLEKRLQGLNVAAEEALETGSKVAELAAKGWEALAKTTEKLAGNFQESVADSVEQTKGAVDEKIGAAKENAGELKEKAQQKASEAKERVEETADGARQDLGDAKEDSPLKVKDSFSASEDVVKKDSFADAVDKMTHTADDQQTGNAPKGSNAKPDGPRPLATAATDPVPVERDDEWTGKKGH